MHEKILKILLVDDDLTVHFIIQQAVKEMNEKKNKLDLSSDSKIELTVCDNSYDAVDLLRESEFDLILLDNELEYQDSKIRLGFDVLDESGIKTPFYMITSYQDDTDLDSLACGAVRRGCLDFIVKPLIHDVLLPTLVIAMHRINCLQKQNAYNFAPMNFN